MLAALSSVILISISGIFPWSPANCWHEEIDIRSGRIRYTRYILCCLISERITSTPLSEALQPSGSLAAIPEWHRVNTFSPGTHHSPHYAFHVAIVQARTLSMLWIATEFTPDAKRESAHRLLSAWQHSKSYFNAGHYLDALSQLVAAHQKQEPPVPIEARELPSNEPGNAYTPMDTVNG